MIRSELIANLCTDSSDRRANDIERVVRTFFSTTIDQLGEGGHVELQGFGAFSVRDYAVRAGRNSTTGQAA
ncbi:integration host factor subunit beta [Sphingobium sp. YR657]|nr:integration host factor subunit beta [Sphingobium sp. YR657]